MSSTDALLAILISVIMVNLVLGLFKVFVILKMRADILLLLNSIAAFFRDTRELHHRTNKDIAQIRDVQLFNERKMVGQMVRMNEVIAKCSEGLRDFLDLSHSAAVAEVEKVADTSDVTEEGQR